MKPGPPPIPFTLKALRGNRGHQKLRRPPKPDCPPKCPDPPSFLCAFAQDEWWRVAPELHALGLLTRADVACLGAYCHAYGQWRLACEALERIANRDEIMHGLLVKTADGNARRNPLVKIASDAAEDMLRFAGEFGLTPVARTRLAAASFSPSMPSKFGELLR
ncbi:phage terminase small subunit P27 family [Bradyrhizobium sp. KB893862 SZCCT0404]|uniref:phage terminase small subunit P27 family n=1 Tax=Bradyrhizobium sp. KB893862 SZCCT0404 TaxID=2807672 RepID=UPI001BA905FB|nr:phage terminase small subunit P27 family [Bradyrhizobium sp. KB893862 SZCCT0404]MBR1174877.1 phage terminase small subunit P27 family [Bradyrhizobium sp. KB893862 SZCCT0404]